MWAAFSEIDCLLIMLPVADRTGITAVAE